MILNGYIIGNYNTEQAHIVVTKFAHEIGIRSYPETDQFMVEYTVIPEIIRFFKADDLTKLISCPLDSDLELIRNDSGIVFKLVPNDEDFSIIIPNCYADDFIEVLKNIWIELVE